MKTTVTVGVVLLAVGYFIGQSRTEPNSITIDETSPETLNENGSTQQSVEIATLKRRVTELETELAKRNEHSGNVVTPISAAVPAESPIAPDVEPSPAANLSSGKDWRRAEKAIAQVSSPSEVSQFLQQARVEDFMTELKSARPILPRDEVIETLNGVYTGSMVPQGGASVPGFTMLMDTRIETKRGSLQGRMSIRLSRGGKTFSRTSNRGDVQSVQRLGEKSLAVVITAGDFHFQLYHIPSLETFEGNCYKQIKPGTLEFVGTVHLERA